MGESSERLSELEREMESLGLRLGAKIGAGSYSTVWAASGKAIKVIRPAEVKPKYAAHFVPRELDILGRVRHPHLVQVERIVRRPGLILIVGELAEGGDLLGHIRRVKRVEEPRARVLFRQLTEALHYLHLRHIAHRDIKCENVLFDALGNVKLCDLGFARYHGPADPLSATFCGSAAYAAPEILRSKPYDPLAADRWSAGVVLYILVTGLMPYDDRHLSKMLERQERHHIHYSRSSTVSPEARGLIADLLHPQPARRLRYPAVVASAWLARTPWTLLGPEAPALAAPTLPLPDLDSSLFHPAPDNTPDLDISAC